MRINFWGVRGSLPTPELYAWRYGGNTPCLEVRASNQLLILDAGTGIRDLGQHLMAERPPGGLLAYLLLSHYHWDHVQGLPFFQPLYQSGNTIHILGPRPQSSSCASLPAVLRTLFRAPFFPVSLEQLQGKYTLRELEGNRDFTVGYTRVRTCPLNHPQGALAYRLDHPDGSLMYVTDHEPGNAACDHGLKELASGADLLVSDAQYHPEELRGAKAGWGHGSWQTSVEVAREAGVKCLILFHHEPVRTDEEVDRLVNQARESFPNTWAAAEGMEIDLTPAGMHVGFRRGARLCQRVPVSLGVNVETSPKGAPLEHECVLQSINFHGAYLLSPRPYELQQPVELVLQLHTVHNGHSGSADKRHSSKETSKETVKFRLRGCVVRTDPQANKNGWVGVAVHFPPSPLIEAHQPSQEPASPPGDAGPAPTPQTIAA